MSKALFVLKIFEFLSWIFAYGEKRLDKRAKADFKIYDVTDWTTKISRSKDNQAMKFGQLTEYNMRSIFLEK